MINVTEPPALPYDPNTAPALERRDQQWRDAIVRASIRERVATEKFVNEIFESIDRRQSQNNAPLQFVFGNRDPGPMYVKYTQGKVYDVAYKLQYVTRLKDTVVTYWGQDVRERALAQYDEMLEHEVKHRKEKAKAAFLDDLIAEGYVKETVTKMDRPYDTGVRIMWKMTIVQIEDSK